MNVVYVSLSLFSLSYVTGEFFGSYTEVEPFIAPSRAAMHFLLEISSINEIFHICHANIVWQMNRKNFAAKVTLFHLGYSTWNRFLIEKVIKAGYLRRKVYGESSYCSTVFLLFLTILKLYLT